MTQTLANDLKLPIRAILIFGFILTATLMSNKSDPMKTITKNSMTVGWKHQNDSVHFMMKAPTTGWVAVGFNTTENMTDAYLVMGNVMNGTTNIIEHYTISPGQYKPITRLGGKAAAANVQGTENDGETILKFSLPIKSENQYSKDLKEDTEYIMILAYSREDDFQHHSIMRTSIKIKL